MGETVAGTALRVGVVVGTYGSGQGSGGQAWLLVQGLRARGYAVRVWSRTGPSDARLPRSRRALTQGRRLLGHPDVDVLFAFERLPGADIARLGGGVHAAWLDAAPDRLRLLRLRARDRRELRLDRDVARSAGWVLCNAQRVASEARAFHGIPRSRVRVIRNGVDLGRFRPDDDERRALRSARGATGRVALFLGHGGTRKGLDVALSAFRRAAAPRDRLWVAGTGIGALPSWAERLGAVDPARVLPAVDALLSPSRYDPSANAVLEAMAAGVPPVTSGRDGASELVLERRLRVQDPGDVEGFAEALRYAWGARSPEQWRQLAAPWPASRMVDETEALIREAASRRSVDG